MSRFGDRGRWHAAVCGLGLASCTERFDFDVPDGGEFGTGGSGGDPTCVADLDCSIAGLRCQAGSCRECVEDGDCPALGLSRCALEQYRCVGCIADSDCPADYACDPLARQCLERCAEDVDCSLGAHGCDSRRGVCIQCDQDEECAESALGVYCAPAGNGCVQCRTDLDCGELHCDALTGHCVECRDSADCPPTARCDRVSHLCSP